MKDDLIKVLLLSIGFCIGAFIALRIMRGEDGGGGVHIHHRPYSPVLGPFEVTRN